MSATESQPTAERRTPLFDAHVAAGAKLVDFAGWQMPIDYGSLREEHQAVRTGVGLFDVSHMGQVEVTGPQAFDCLQHIVSSDVRRLPEGGAQYSLLCNEDGGVRDDLFVYRLAEQTFMVVTNAANHDADRDWMRAHATDYDVDVIDRIDDFAMLAVQGPSARTLVESLADGQLPPRLRCAPRMVAEAPVLICGTGYTGEDGVELLVAPERAIELWDALLDSGARPVGLGARDTLRLEACFHLYGNDLREEWDPIGAGLGWACAEATGFIGAEAIAEVRRRGPEQKLVPFLIEGPGIARQGNKVVGGGVVTSGSFSPSLERGIGLAYLPAPAAVPGTQFQIDVRGTLRDAVVHTKPLFPKGRD